MALALLLLIFVIVMGPTLAIFKGMLSTSADYLSNIVSLSVWTDRQDSEWMHGWTVFYWAWWISWSPFVGMFIARISRGRTVREFMIAVLLVPTLVTIVWMSSFGISAIEQAQNGIGGLASGIDTSTASLATFQMLENLPFSQITTGLGILLVMMFFVTSSDSGSLVIDSITAGGKLDAPVPQRIFWAVMEGSIAGALIFGGGKEALNALQAGAIATGLPFTVVLLFMCFCLYRGLSEDRRSLSIQPLKS